MTGSAAPPYRALVLCRVIDNYGDAGVCWRLARQLASEYGWQVRLAIDRPQVLQRLGAYTAEDTGAGRVEIEAWCASRASRTDTRFDPAAIDIIISAFGAEPPAALRRALAGGARRPLWVQLEYLSAEDWVRGHHGARSPKPADGAVEHFYYPGFHRDTGGLLRETGLFDRRDAFRASGEQQAWLERHSIRRRPEERLATLFCYPEAPVAAWFDLLTNGPHPWLVIVPEGVADRQIGQWAARRGAARQGAARRQAAGPQPAEPDPAPPVPTGPHAQRLRCGRLTVQTIPFLAQDDYDRLLWSADLNIVRGEDSWVRAQWAARPFLWQPYRQAQQRHLVKLDAFLDEMRADTLIRDAMSAWSGRGDWAAAWQAFEAGFDDQKPLYARWGARLGAQSDLCTRFIEFCRQRLQ